MIYQLLEDEDLVDASTGSAEPSWLLASLLFVRVLQTAKDNAYKQLRRY